MPPARNNHDFNRDYPSQRKHEDDDDDDDENTDGEDDNNHEDNENSDDDADDSDYVPPSEEEYRQAKKSHKNAQRRRAGNFKRLGNGNVPKKGPNFVDHVVDNMPNGVVALSSDDSVLRRKHPGRAPMRAAPSSPAAAVAAPPYQRWRSPTPAPARAPSPMPVMSRSFIPPPVQSQPQYQPRRAMSLPKIQTMARPETRPVAPRRHSAPPPPPASLLPQAAPKAVTPPAPRVRQQPMKPAVVPAPKGPVNNIAPVKKASTKSPKPIDYEKKMSDLMKKNKAQAKELQEEADRLRKLVEENKLVEEEQQLKEQQLKEEQKQKRERKDNEKKKKKKKKMMMMKKMKKTKGEDVGEEDLESNVAVKLISGPDGNDAVDATTKKRKGRDIRVPRHTPKVRMKAQSSKTVAVPALQSANDGAVDRMKAAQETLQSLPASSSQPNQTLSRKASTEGFLSKVFSTTSSASTTPSAAPSITPSIAPSASSSANRTSTRPSKKTTKAQRAGPTQAPPKAARTTRSVTPAPASVASQTNTGRNSRASSLPAAQRIVYTRPTVPVQSPPKMTSPAAQPKALLQRVASRRPPPLFNLSMLPF